MQVITPATGEREETDPIRRFDELHTALRILNEFDQDGSLGSWPVFKRITEAADAIVDAMQADADERDEAENLLGAIDNGLLDEGDEETPAMPAQCERCGNEFRNVRWNVINEDGERALFGAVLIGSRWVCNDCEDAEGKDYHFDTDEWLNMKAEDDFSAMHDEGEF